MTPCRRSAALLAAAAMALAACGNSDGAGETGASGASGSDESIKIGATWDLSGPTASLGETGVNGAELAVKMINAEGGIDGRDLELQVLDDGCDPAKGVANVRRLIGDSSVVAITGFACSPVALAAKPIVDQAQVPTLASQATSTEIHTPSAKHMWMSNVPADAESAALTEAVMTHLKPERLAVIEVANAYGKASGEGVQKWLEENGHGDVLVGRIDVPVTGTDFGAQMLKLKKLQPDVTMQVVYDDRAVLTAMKQQGIETSSVLFSGGITKATVTGLAEADLLTGITSSAMWPELIASDSGSEEMAKYATAFQQEYGEWPDNGSLEGYQAILLLKEAMERGGISRDGIQQAFEEEMTDIDLGLYFPMSFSADQHAGASDVTILTYQSNDVPGHNGLYGDATIASG
jgi:branched-chain amino acid transport system substrate-binding protein